jgi:MerR family transcriptional regulator, mercuric resistance operon regulatory protein
MPPITDARAPALTIGELSRQTGVNVETIRYYERVQMLPAPPRTAGGRRAYGAPHRRALRFIRRARDLGFSLNEVRTLLDLDGAERASCAEVRKIASVHLASVRAKLADLARLESILSRAVAQCADDATQICPMLDILDAEQGNGQVGVVLGG